MQSKLQLRNIIRNFRRDIMGAAVDMKTSSPETAPASAPETGCPMVDIINEVAKELASTGISPEAKRPVGRPRTKPLKEKEVTEVTKRRRHVKDKEDKPLKKRVNRSRARIVDSVLTPSTTNTYDRSKFMIAHEACELLSVHNCTLHSWQKKGLLEGYRNENRIWMYNIERFLEETDMVQVQISVKDKSGAFPEEIGAESGALVDTQ